MTPGNQGIQALDVQVHGVGVNHGEVNQYVVRDDAPPDQKLKAAKANLRTGMRDRAEQLIDEAIDGSTVPSADALYYRALSLVSRRSPEDLTDEDWHKLRHTLDQLRDEPGEYGAAGRALHRLIQASVSPVRQAGQGARPAVARWLDEVPDTEPGRRRSELKDHLRYVIRSIERDALDSDEEGALGARLSDDREKRAPFFFTPDPLLNSPQPPEEPEKFDPGILLFLGVLGVVAAVTMLLVQIPDDLLPADRVLAYLSVVLGCAALAVGVPEMLRSIAENARRKEWQTDPEGEDESDRRPDSGPSRRQTAWLGVVLNSRTQWREERENQARQRQRTKKEIFRRTVEGLVQERFVQEEPEDSETARKWRKHTEKLRRDLVDELTHRHWPSGTPGALDWIIQLRAKEIGRQRFDDLQVSIVARSRRIRRQCVFAGCLLIAFAAFRIIPAHAPDTGVWACFLLIASVVLSMPAVRYYARLRLHHHDKERYEAELPERAAWQRKVHENRPRDAEMARWYDLDQRFLRREVLGEHQMEHRDILFSFFLVEGVPGCVRAKVRNGPLRYSHYLLTFYVLTSSGVWVSAWAVDFATGEHEGRHDTVFRYDAISSVMLESVGVRFNDSQREIVSLTEEGRLRDVADEDGVVLREALRLDLHNGQRLMAQLENYEELSDPDEGLGQLRRLALESSGITAGFRILTAMATEGMKWFELRRQRAHRALVGSGHPGDGDRGVRPPAEPAVLLLSDQAGSTP